MDWLRVAARVPVTRAEGPGARFALWLQGCSIRCPGCCNPHLFTAAGGEVQPVPRLLAAIDAASPAIEGITVLGGEPFDQAAGLAALLEGVADRGLSILVFTGFTIEELRGHDDAATARALARIDVLVDGRYEAAQPERDRLWAGSRNQRFHYLSRRYTPAIERARDGEPDERIEIRVAPGGQIEANGWPALGVALGLPGVR